jgi:hypothetical protein
MVVAAADVAATGVVAAHVAVVDDAVAVVDVAPENAAVAAARGPAADYRGRPSSSSQRRCSQRELGWRGQRASSPWCLESDG